jgi:hypothetical protein
LIVAAADLSAVVGEVELAYTEEIASWRVADACR